MQSKAKPDDKAKREAAFAVYRDMGVSRSYTRLREAMKLTRHGDVTVRTLSTWSTAEHWPARLTAFDRTQAKAASAMPAPAGSDPDFDQADALLRTAHLALQRVLTRTTLARSSG